jgi:hypothetical protein
MHSLHTYFRSSKRPRELLVLFFSRSGEPSLILRLHNSNIGGSLCNRETMWWHLPNVNIILSPSSFSQVPSAHRDVPKQPPALNSTQPLIRLPSCSQRHRLHPSKCHWEVALESEPGNLGKHFNRGTGETITWRKCHRTTT